MSSYYKVSLKKIKIKENIKVTREQKEKKKKKEKKRDLISSRIKMER
jgi:hypothetical protein